MEGLMQRTPDEQDAVDFIARMLAGADVLDVESVNDLGFPTKWLLVPVGHAELDFLAAYRAEREDFEDGGDDEESADAEPSLGSVGSCVTADRANQERWATDTDWYSADCELDRSDDEPDDEDVEHDGREPEDYAGGMQPRWPVIPTIDERPAVPVTRHTDMSEWRKLP